MGDLDEASFIIAIVALGIAAVLCAGGLYVLLKQQIIIDKDTGAIIDVDIPFFGKLRTNVPSISAIFLGAGLVVGTLLWSKPHIEELQFDGKIKIASFDRTKFFDIYANIIPTDIRGHQTSEEADNEGNVSFHLSAPKIGSGYEVVYYSPSLPRDGQNLSIARSKSIGFLNGNSIPFSGSFDLK